MNVKVSVILPSLNVADYIERCLESVIHQSLKELEILCVDAGSADGTSMLTRIQGLKFCTAAKKAMADRLIWD